ncbi:MAG: hypothetical protein ACE5E5_08520 [Phycisphaerae bacterium]
MSHREEKPSVRRRTIVLEIGRWGLAVACSTCLIGPACGLNAGHQAKHAPAQIIKGRDSAGAAIELEKRGDQFTTARVFDLVLGTGQSEIHSDEDGSLEFTIDFPGGTAITYRGRQVHADEADDVLLSGTWRQHPGGVFGEDIGTWEAQIRFDEMP